MEEAEDYAHRHHYTTLHLFTLNKEGFYDHLGYGRGQAITPQRKCTANLDLQQVGREGGREGGRERVHMCLGTLML